MQVARLGLTPVKGMARATLARLELTGRGPRDDRRFCLVDGATGRVVRTIEDDALMACRADWRAPILTIHTPIGEATGAVADGHELIADYWGREAAVVTVEGPWTALISRYLGRQVLLCRVLRPGAVVWAGSVSLITTSSVAEVARRLGRGAVDSERFRATVVVDTGSRPAFTEDEWVGRRIRLGAAVIAVAGRLGRCAVIDRRPGAGGRDAGVLACLAGDRAVAGEVVFGLEGNVEQSGWVRLGDEVAVLDAR